MSLHVRNIEQVSRVMSAQATQDGDGVAIHRIAGNHLNAVLDPFLLIDEIRSDDQKDYIGGFPPHPHRGFQTFTYMLQGGFAHTDSMGNKGEISGGGLQWMSAARGVVHSEMPRAEAGRLHGYQFWVNLPGAHKMDPPDYRDVQGEDVPEYHYAGHDIRALLGDARGVDGVRLTGALALPHTPVTLLDVTMRANQPLALRVPAGWTMQVLVVEGQLGKYPARHLLHFNALREASVLQLASMQATRCLVFGGQPLQEPVAQYGPFVMNSMDEVEQALRDFREGTLVAG